MKENKYILTLFRNSKEFRSRLEQLGLVKHDDSYSANFKKELDSIIKHFYILDSKDSRAEIIGYMSTLRQGFDDVAPYAIHRGSLSNTDHLKLDKAKAVIVIYDRMTKRQFNSIWDNVIKGEKEFEQVVKRTLPKESKVFQHTGRMKGFDSVDDALKIYRIKQEGLTLEDVFKQKPVKMTSDNYNTLYYKIKKLIDSQSLEN